MCFRKPDGVIIVDLSGESEAAFQIKFDAIKALRKKKIVLKVEDRTLIASQPIIDISSKEGSAKT